MDPMPATASSYQQLIYNTSACVLCCWPVNVQLVHSVVVGAQAVQIIDLLQWAPIMYVALFTDSPTS